VLVVIILLIIVGMVSRPGRRQRRRKAPTKVSGSQTPPNQTQTGVGTSGLAFQNTPPDCKDPYKYYIYHNPDLQRVLVKDWGPEKWRYYASLRKHWDEQGYNEGRKSCWPKPPDCSDPDAYYYYFNKDVKNAGLNTLDHWNEQGYKEKRKSCWKPPK
jgi:hypothetical protein